MPSLSVSNFSCIVNAEIELAPVNVIIGPQGSGKSLTTKLFYFFTDLVTTHALSAERGESLEDFKRNIARQFAIWFPPSAWGTQRFTIYYTADKFSIRIMRRMSGGRPTDSVAVRLSDWFEAFYGRSLALFERARAGDEIELDTSITAGALDRMWRAREMVSRRLQVELGDEFLTAQTFIPAGRAFFTSIGRLVAGLEQAGLLDPVTVKFARLFATLRDRSSRNQTYRAARLSEDMISKRTRFMDRLFGGEIRYEGDSEFVETNDGRKIPFSSLSSGQQELLPMWSLIDYFAELDDARRVSPSRNTRARRELVYIEEPEAHLFPSAQSLLMEFLIGSVVNERSRRNLIITTHSPYIMSKLNVFLKAGQLSRRRKRNQSINDIVPRECWLDEERLSAYAIQDGQLVSIMDDDGMIDGSYLDEISDHIAKEYSELLQIESEI
jgi:energy-coupling factor transporter ATP-binding protein EcfA2